jgi:hypothetical protein
MPDELRPDERQRQAAALHIAGLTYEEIAERLGYSHRSGAYEAAKVGMQRETLDSKSDLLEVELRRLDIMFMAVWVNARKGSVVAVDRALKIMDRRAKFLGLDSSPSDAVPAAEVVSEVAKQRAKREQRRSKASGA